MSLLDVLRKNLSEDLFAQVTDALGDDFNYDQVPRSRLNKVIAQRNAAQSKLDALSGQGDDDDDGGDDPIDNHTQNPAQGTKAKTYTQKDLDAAVQAAMEETNKKLQEQALKFAATEKLREAKFVDPALVLDAGLIDFSKVQTDDKGNITGGLDDQITAIATARPYMVAASDAGGAPTGTGRNGGAENFGSITSREEFMKLDTAKQIEFKTTYPDVFKGFMEQL